MTPGTIVLASSTLIGPLTVSVLADAIRSHDVAVITASAPQSVTMARSRGWPLVELDGHHLWPLVRPDTVAAAVLSVVHRL